MTTPAVSAWAGCPRKHIGPGMVLVKGHPDTDVEDHAEPCPTCALHNAAVAAAVEAEREAIKLASDDWSSHANQDRHKMTKDQRTGFALAQGVLDAHIARARKDGSHAE